MSADAHGNLSGKRLVIFGCGYVGAEVARQAVARGLPVTALTRNETRAAALRAGGIEVVVADLASDAWHGRIPGGADFVLNCVGSGGGGLAGYWRSYFEGMASVLAWLRTRGAADTFVYTSSTSVYPQGGEKPAGAGSNPLGYTRPGVPVIDETAPIDSTHERTRVLVETEALLRAGRAGAPGVSDGRDVSAVRAYQRCFILRLAGIYGPDRHRLLDQVRAGGPIDGHGEYHLNLIHRDDIVSAMWAVMAAPPALTDEIFNVADDGAATKSAVVSWLAARLGVPVPDFTGVAGAGRRAATPDRIISNARLKARLGWQPQFADFRAGYEKILSR